MAQDHDLDVGRTAVELGLISNDDLGEALALRRAKGGSTPFAQFLQEWGFLDLDACRTLTRATRGPAAPAGPPDADLGATRTHVPRDRIPEAEASSARPAPQEPGRAARAALGPFEIIGELGKGGMGRVYLARDPRLDRTVALKVMASDLATHAEARKRFLREARTAAGLDHPHIVKVYEVGEAPNPHGPGQPYIAMEYVEGTDFARRLHPKGGDDDPIALRPALDLVRQAAEALAYAHGQGLVHRDVKPANILVQMGTGSFSRSATESAPFCTAKLTDFGLARGAQDEAATRLTKSGVAMGTPHYMSPEQWSAIPEEIQAPADQYALGAMLYEVLTGAPPFAGTTDMRVLAAQAAGQDPPPPGALNPAVHRDLETICLKALEKEPEHRYPDCEALAEDLRRFLDGEIITARPAGRLERTAKWVRRNRLAAAGLGTAAAVILLVLALVLGLSASRWMRRSAEFRDLLAGARAATAAFDTARAAGYAEAEPLADRAVAAWQSAAEHAYAGHDARRGLDAAREARADLLLEWGRGLAVEAEAARQAAEDAPHAEWVQRFAGVAAAYLEAGRVLHLAAQAGRMQAADEAAEARLAADRAKLRPRAKAENLLATYRSADFERGGTRELLKRAEGFLTQAIEADPDFADAWYRRGVVRARLAHAEANRAYIRNAHDDFVQAYTRAQAMLPAYWKAAFVRLQHPESFDVSEPPTFEERYQAIRAILDRAPPGAMEEFGALLEPYLAGLRGELATPDMLESVRVLRDDSPFKIDAELILGSLLWQPPSYATRNLLGVYSQEHPDGHIREALVHLDRHLALEPNSPEGLSTRWQVRCNLGDLPGALADLEAWMALMGQEYVRSGSLATLKMLLGKEREAIEQLRSVAETAGPGGHVLMDYANLLAFRGRYDEAFRYFDRAIIDGPGEAGRVTIRARQSAASAVLHACVAGDAVAARRYLDMLMSMASRDARTQGETTRLDGLRFPKGAAQALMAGAYPFLAPPEAKQLHRSPVFRMLLRQLDERASDLDLDGSEGRGARPSARMDHLLFRRFMVFDRLRENLARVSRGIPPQRVRDRGPELTLEQIAWLCFYLAAREEEARVLAITDKESFPDDLLLAEDHVARAAWAAGRGKLGLAELDLEQALRVDADNLNAAYGLATVRARLAANRPESIDPALEALRRAILCGWEHLDWTARDEDFAALHTNERFQTLVREFR